MRNEMNRAEDMVRDRALKKEPVSPPRKGEGDEDDDGRRTGSSQWRKKLARGAHDAFPVALLPAAQGAA